MSGELEVPGGDARPEAALKKLRALGLRGHERDARALLGGPPPGQARLLEALNELEALEGRRGPRPGCAR
ncbi:MAG: hypothetical protein M0D55_08620 [Elusimicrobiota bacterium]|nr:MAG: hypothetical protein M0D55_08620 [Elusimicrobiota bacterium]